MAGASDIEWTDMTWNPVTGCTKISQGCKNCYAERMSKRLRAMGEWVDSILAQCHDAGVPFFFKQWGGVRKKKTGRSLNGRTYDEFPLILSEMCESVASVSAVASM